MNRNSAVTVCRVFGDNRRLASADFYVQGFRQRFFEEQLKKLPDLGVDTLLHPRAARRFTPRPRGLYLE